MTDKPLPKYHNGYDMWNSMSLDDVEEMLAWAATLPPITRPTQRVPEMTPEQKQQFLNTHNIKEQ